MSSDLKDKLPGPDLEGNTQKDLDLGKRKRSNSDDAESPSAKIQRKSHITKQSRKSVDRRIQRGKKKTSVKATPAEKKPECSIITISSTDSSVIYVSDPSNEKKREASDDGEAPKKKARRSISESDRKFDLDDIEYTFDHASAEEERIFQLSSSGNRSKHDFESKYEQLNPIGAGGFGSVYTGTRKSDNLSVAIKHILREYVIWERVICNGKIYKIIVEVAFMLKAAGLPGSCRRSAAVQLLDWFLLDDELILVMEQPVICQDLLGYCERHGGSLEEHEAKMILKQLVDAAIDLHSKGIFHRDIKLQNTLVDLSLDEPRVRVIDFGCSTFSTQSYYKDFCGTLDYFPPEWFNSRVYWAHATTVWQLGVVFYSMLSGHEPFNTPKFFHNCIKINSALSAEVKNLLHMCLAKDHRKRATLQKLKRALS